jgi:hypothetical protein
LHREQALAVYYSLTVNLSKQTIADKHGLIVKFEVAPSRKEVLLKGLDDIGTTLQHQPDIDSLGKKTSGYRHDVPAGRRKELLQRRVNTLTFQRQTQHQPALLHARLTATPCPSLSLHLYQGVKRTSTSKPLNMLGVPTKKGKALSLPLF